jgi:hypothetical protein
MGPAFATAPLMRVPLKWDQRERQTQSAPSPLVGLVGEGRGGGSELLREMRPPTATPTPNPSPQGPTRGRGAHRSRGGGAPCRARARGPLNADRRDGPTRATPTPGEAAARAPGHDRDHRTEKG